MRSRSVVSSNFGNADRFDKMEESHKGVSSTSGAKKNSSLGMCTTVLFLASLNNLSILNFWGEKNPEIIAIL